MDKFTSFEVSQPPSHSPGGPVAHRFAVLSFAFVLGAQAIAQQPSNTLQPGQVKDDGLIHVDLQTRINYLSRAQLWHPVNLDDIDTRSGGQVSPSKTIPNDAIIECDYVYDASLGGTTNKFKCTNPKITQADGTPVVTK